MLEREVRSVACLLPGVLDHLRRDVDADHASRGKAIRDQQRRGPRAGADVERRLNRSVHRGERSLQRSERVGAAHRVPDRREHVELLADQRADERPESWEAHRDVRREPRVAAAQPLLQVPHGTSRLIRTSCPARALRVCAALPPFIATATLPYESS